MSSEVEAEWEQWFDSDDGDVGAEAFINRYWLSIGISTTSWRTDDRRD